MSGFHILWSSLLNLGKKISQKYFFKSVPPFWFISQHECMPEMSSFTVLMEYELKDNYRALYIY